MTSTAEEGPRVQKARQEFSPVVHKEFPEMGSNRTRLRVRLLQHRHPYFGVSEPRLDIRKYLENHENRDGTIYTGFTREGVSLTWDDLQELAKILPTILDLMDAIPEEKKGHKG